MNEIKPVTLSATHISRGFGARPVLKDVTFAIPTGSIVGLIGPSGGGKSTLIKILGGIARSDSGEVMGLDRSRNSVALMFQEGALFDSLNVFDNVAFPLVGGRVPTFTLPRRRQVEVRDKVEAILERVGLVKAAAKMPGQLSGGMRRRVSLARTLVARPQFVLLDDPTSGLDPVASSVIMKLIVDLHREYKPTTIMVSHDLRRLLPVVDIIIGLFGGEVRFMGNLAGLRACECPEVRRFVSCRFDLH